MSPGKFANRSQKRKGALFYFSQIAGLTCLLFLVNPAAAEIRPHVIGLVHYEGELGAAKVDPDKVVIFRKLPAGVTVLGTCLLVVADQVEPSADTSEALFKEVAAHVGGDAVGVAKSEDASDEFRKPKKGKPRGISALEEYEMAALVARAHGGGGQLLVGKKKFLVHASDRFGDSDVKGPVTFTLSRTHDERLWAVGKAGPRYRAESRSRFVTVVGGPSGKKYDVKIVGRRAKVFFHNRRELITADTDGGMPETRDEPELYYTRFTIKIGTFSDAVTARQKR